MTGFYKTMIREVKKKKKFKIEIFDQLHTK